jgi:hypothetical protein
MSRTYAHPRLYEAHLPALGQFDPELEPHGLWSETLRSAISYYLKRVCDFIQSYLMFQVGSQFCITIAQTLDVHFLQGRDSFGFFPRYLKISFLPTLRLASAGWTLSSLV